MGDRSEEGPVPDDSPLGAGALRTIYHAVNDAIFVHDADGEVIDVNRTAAEMYGYDRADFRDGDLPETSSGDGSFTVEGSIDRLQDVAAGDRQTFEWQGQDRDGNVFWEEVSVSRTDVDGETRLIAIVRDIDDRKRYEQELEYRKALLEAQAESTIDGFLVEDDGDALSYNSRFLDLWDVPAERVQAGSDSALDPVSESLADPDPFRDAVADLATDPDAERRDEVELADGRWVDWYSSPVVGADEEHYGRLWVFRDVTERKERERALQRKNERLEEFASIVSHDLRNPLTVADGRLELAMAESDSEHLAGVREAHERMERLIDDLLTLAREGAAVQDLEPLDLASVVAECWQYVDTGDARLVTETDGTIMADRSRLRQVFENLIRNAVDSEDGTVTVRVGDCPGGFYVADDGPGVPVEDREAVFETGYSTSAAGTGFGLSIVKRVAEAHGWSLSLGESEAGGARFEFADVERPGEARPQ
jgi:PAS domain S-box-containing protein